MVAKDVLPRPHCCCILLHDGSPIYYRLVAPRLNARRRRTARMKDGTVFTCVQPYVAAAHPLFCPLALPLRRFQGRTRMLLRHITGATMQQRFASCVHSLTRVTLSLS